MTWQIHAADVLEWLASYDGPKFHAVLSDPPYGLAFMGQGWDSFRSNVDYQQWVTEWATLLIEKALYPGAVCLFFGGTRTWHRLACGLEDAGFEVCDTLMYLYGSGFPKSMAMDKAIDRQFGKERERKVVGKHPMPRANVNATAALDGSFQVAPNVTLPATPEAAHWNGYGTALKPAWEPVILCRAPRGKHRYIDLALEYGTGALWIDGCRIAGPAWGRSTPHRDDIRGDNFGRSNGRRIEWEPQASHPSGRWPANLLLMHLPECERVGERHVKSSSKATAGGRRKGGNSYGDYAGYETPLEIGYADADSKETVEAWECVEGCPVVMLDGQSGVSVSKGGVPKNLANDRLPWIGSIGPTTGGLGDKGGASRFFYTAKASRRERNAGLPEGMTNKHPTVKPLKITEYLARLILPPELGGPRRLLAPFAGTGSEMIGGLLAGWDDVAGIELDADAVEVAGHRLAHWASEPRQVTLL